MAREKTAARKLALINPDSEDRPNAGDAHKLAQLERLAAPDGPSLNAISLGGASYSQNFDGLTGTALPTDWFFSETGTNANATYALNNGGATTGNTYSYGDDASSDRAFGGLRSGSLISTIGASFTNSTGGTINSLLINYTGEQWRLGATGRNDRLDFEISFNATSLTTGTWVAVDGLDFIAPVSTGVAGALNGNANSVSVAFNITQLTIASGATFWIRWLDFDAAGSDDGLAIDNFTLATPGALAVNDVALNEGNAGSTAFTFTVTRSGGSSGAVGATWTIGFPGGAGGANSGDLAAGQGLTGSVSFANGETSKTITVNVNGDSFPEDTETFNLTLSAPTGGATISDATGVGTIANDDFPGAISIDDVSHIEGNGGTTLYTFTVSRTGQAANTSVQWALGAPGGAGNAGATDFPTSQALSGTISFAAGETSRTIAVSVLSDRLYEPNESFTITLSNPSPGATIADGTGIGTIVNDDDAPPFTPDGNEVIVNQNLDQDQVGPRVAWIDAGHYVVTWTSHETPTSYEVMARLFNADGTPAGDEFQVNTASAGDQVGNRVAALSGGGFVIVWSDVTTTDIRAQMFNADGSPDGTELALSTDSLNAQSVPWVSALPGGGFAAVWMHNDGVSYDIRGRTFDADGQPASAEFAVNSNTALNQQYAQTTTLTNGHFVVVWHDNGGVGGDASSTSIKMRVFDTDGTALTAETLVNTTIAGMQQFPAVGALAGGGYVVAWEDYSASGDDISGNALRARLYDAAGNAMGSEFIVNFTTEGDQSRPTIAALPDGGFVIGWWNQADGVSVNEIRAQAFDALGNRRGGEFEVNSDAAGDQIGPAFAASPVNGHLVATWNDFNDSQELTDGEIEQRLFSPPNPGALSIADLSQAEGGTGATAFTFIVTRTGGSLGSVGASWTLDLSGTATSADFFIFPQSGIVSFADGQTGATIVVQVQGNATFEPDETFTVTLSAPTGGATIGDGSGTGMIVNDDNPAPPTIDLNGPEGGTMSNAFYTENGAAVPIAFDPQIATADPGGIAQVDVRIRADYVWTGDVLSVEGTLPGGITVEILSDVHLILHANGASLDDIEAALEQIRYHSTNPDANGGPMPHPQRVVDVTVSDAGGRTGTTLCQVVVGNASPTVDLNGAASGVDFAAAYTENGAGAALGSDIVITAPQPIQGIEIAIAGAVTGDLLFVDGTLPGGITAFGGQSGAPLYLTGSGSAADWQAALATVRYRSLIDNPDAYGNLPTRTITITVQDTERTGTATTTVTIAAINDAPVVTTTAGTTMYAESVNVAPGTIVVNNALTVADADDMALAGATVSITANFQAGEDILAFTNSNFGTFGNIAASYNGGTGVLTLTSAGGTASVAQWQAALRAVTYSNSAQEPSQATRTISFVVNDGDADSLAATRLLSVTAQNDSPSGANATLSIGEDSVFTFNASHFGFSDVDGDAFFGVRFGAAPVGGTLYFDADGTGGNAPLAITSFPTGTYGAADIALGKLTFVPASNLNGTAAASVSFTVLDNGGTVGAGQNADLSPNMLTFDIAAVNDAATFGGQASGTVTEDGTTAAAGALSVDDVDGAGEEHFEAQLDAATAYGTFSIDQNGGWSYQLDNSHPDVQALDAADPPLTDTIVVRSLDGTPTNVVITINGADEPPVGAPSVDLDGGAGGIDYDGSLTEGSATGIGVSIQVTQGTFPITGATVTLTDGLAGDSLSVVGTLPAGITNISGNDQQIQLVGINMSAAQWATALGQIAFTSSSDNPDNYGADTARTINVEVSDGVTISATATATIAIAAVNDAPTVGALDGDSVTWTEGDAHALLDRNMAATVFDPDNQNFAGGFLSVGVQVNPSAEDEFFALDVFSVVYTNFNDVYVSGVHIGTITSAGPGQILTISFTAGATAARVATLLDHIAYRNVAGDVPTAGPRSVTYLLNDGHGGASGGVVTVDVVAVNDGPTVADTFIAIDEDQIWVLSLADFDIVDPEGDAIASIMIGGVSSGLIYYDADGAGAGQPEAVTDYPRTFSFGDIAAGRLSWVPEADLNGISFFQYGVTDDRGAASAGARVYFDAAPVTDAPTVDLNGTNQAGTSFGAVYVEGSSAARIADLDVAITSESGVLTGATIRITDALAGDLLSVVGSLPGAITALYDPGTATLTLSGQATLAQYQTALTQLRYSSTSENPGASGTDTQRAIEIVVTDGVAEGAPSSAPAVTTVTVAGINDVPVITIPAGTTIYAESVNTAPAAVVVNNAITIADVDDTSLASATVWIVNYQSSQDSLAFINNNAATFGNIAAIFDNGLGVLTLLSAGGTATLAQWQAALRAVTYSNSSEEPSQVGRTVVFKVNDGDDDSAAATRLLSVTAQNDSPSGADATRTINEDARFTITSAHLGFSDVDGDAFAGVRFGAAPVGGTLYFDADGAGGNAPVAVTSFPTTTYSAADLAAGRLSFLPTANLNGTGAASVSFSVVDNGGTVGAGQNTDLTPNTLTFNITSINDAPTGADKTIIVAEDGSYTLTVADFGFSDVDGNAFDSVILHHPVSGGTLYINGNPMTNFTVVYLHTVQSGGLVFVPAANATGAVGGLTFSVRDDGGFANGGEAADTTPNVLTFSMTPVNDAPVNSVPGAQAVDEDGSLVFSTANGNALSVADVDAVTLTVTLSVAHGTLILASNVGLTFLDGDGDATMTFSGTAAAINTALGAGLTYAPAADYHGGDALSITTSDGGQAGAGGTRTDADAVAITISPVGDPPVIANLDHDDVTFVEGSAAIRIDLGGDALVTDVDSADFDGGSLQVILGEGVPGEDVLGFATGAETGITLSNGTSTGSIVSIGGIAIGAIVAGSPTPNSFTVNFNASADAADVTTLLRAITYLNTNTDNPSSITRGIVIFVSDGDGTGQAGAASTVHVTRVNDAPVNAVPGGQAIDEDSNLTLSTANGNALSVADVDATTLTVTLSAAHGSLTLASMAGLTFSDSAGDASMTFSGTAAAINAALGAGLTYVPTANYNGGDSISMVTTDGGQSGTGPAGTDSDSVAVGIAAINDAPAGADAAFTINEDSSFTFAEAHFGFTDAVEGDDFLGIVIASIPAAGTLLHDGAAVTAGQFVSLHDIALGRLTFAPAADANGAPYGGFTFQVRDDGGIGNGGQDTDQSPNIVTFNVTAVNDAPANTVPGGQTINEDASLTLSTGNGNAISVADVDATTLTVTLSVAHGTLTIASTLGLTFSGGSDGTADASMTFSGTAAAINAALGAGLTYNPNANFNGSDAISVVTTDGGQTGTGPVGTDSDSIAVGITAINDAPSGTSATITLDEDGTRTLTQADFGFSDTVEGHGFAGVVITTLPANGTLLLNGAALLVAETFVTAAELADGQLVFQPGANANGAAYAALTFQVRDDGGTGNGGQDTDPGADTLTFNVAAINDSPLVDLNGAGAGASATLDYAENGAAAAIAPAGTITDVDTADFGGGTLWVAITNGLNAEDILSILNQGTGAGQVGYANGLISYEGVTVADLLPTLGFPIPVLDIRFRSNVAVSPAAVQAVLQAIAYRNISQDPATTPRTVTFSFNDGDGNPAGGDPPGNATATINVASVNDAPSGAGATIATAEDGSRVLTQADFGFSDPAEGDAFAGVLLTSLPANGALLLNGVAIAVAGTFVSAAQLAAGQLVFAPGPDGNGAGYASFDFAVRDDGGTANGGLDTDQSPNTLTINVTAISDAPAGADATITINEDSGRVLTAADFGFSDTADGNAFAGVVLTSLPTAGFLIYDPDGAGGLPGVFANVGRFITAAELALGALTYYPPSHASGAALASFTFQVRDNGGTANGGQDTDQSPNTISFNVNPANDAPSGADRSVTGSEDDPYVFAAADFGFTDPVEGNAFFAVRISTLPTAGDILLNGVAVLAGDAIAVSAINAGMLTFQPDPDGSGAPYASFTFQVRDSGGTANGGVDTDQSPNTITITITPDNLAPVLDLDAGAPGADAALAYAENDPATRISPAATLTDDSADFAGGTITAHFTANGAAQDQLSILGGNGIAVSPTDDTLFYGGVLIGSWGGGVNGADLVVQLNANATAAAVEAVLRAIAYANLSDNPSVLARTIDVAVTDGDGGAASALVTVNLTAADDAAVARNDAFAIDETAILSSNVFLDHGAGADGDVDGPGLSVAAVNGSSLSVGQQIQLESGALLTLNADGSFSYATNHAFDSTPTGASGASNTPAFDHFTYTLAGGGTATVTLAIAGLDSDDTLFGTAGADVLAGGNGNDSYRVENAADLVVESAGGGRDGVYVAMNLGAYALAAGSEVEILSAIDPASAAAMNLTGNEFANMLIGTAGSNTLIGGGGADALFGGAGNDFYRVEEAGDIVVEFAGGGFDSVYAVTSYTLAAGSEIELLSAIDPASTAAMNLTGNEYANRIYGNAAGNTLIGGGGDDVLFGGAGNDFYRVETAGDVVVEYAGGGFDSVYAVESYALAAGSEVELLSAIDPASSAAMNLTGNEFANRIYGNAGVNVLIGGGGADILFGGAGNDIYRVEDAGDLVVEAVGGGADAVYAVASYALNAGAEVELLSAIDPGSAGAMDLTGNDFANTIVGTAGANTLIGGGGDDALAGGLGNDVYRVEDAGDIVLEYAGGGADAVYAVGSYTLQDGYEVEVLAAVDPSSTAAQNLAGNDHGNTIFASNGANFIDGRGGSDALVGYGGADVFAFTTALGIGNVDTIVDFVSGTDRIGLDYGIFTAIGGTLGADAFVIGAAATGTEDRIVYNQATGQLFYDSDGSGGGAAILFATLQGAPVLSAGDFTMI